MQPAVNRSEVENPAFLRGDWGETKPLPISLDAELKNTAAVTGARAAHGGIIYFLKNNP